MKNSLFIAVENYSDPSLGPVKYAETDAQSFAAVLEQHGFTPVNRTLLLGEQATKTSIESALRITLKRLAPEDTLALFYAGHGFANQDGAGFLTSFDTHVNDPEYTSVSLRWLAEQLQGSKCPRMMLFLDASCGALTGTKDWPEVYTGLELAELQRFLESAPESVGFASCAANESSHVNVELKHRIWTWQLTQAFAGKISAALEGTRLTAAGLQRALEKGVATTLRKIDPRGVQTPILLGSASSNLLLADLDEVFAQREAAHDPHAAQVKDSVLLAERIMRVSNLSGFKKGYSIPSRHGSAAQAFINTLSAADIETDVENVRSRLKREFRFKRLEVTVDNDGDGGANVATPYFNYNVSVLQDPADPSQVVWRRSVDAITDPGKVLSRAFEAVFTDAFDTVELTLRDGIDLEQLVDAIESRDSNEITVQYDDDEAIRVCTISIKGHNLLIKVTKNTFSIVLPSAKGPKILLQFLMDVQRALKTQHNVPGLPFA